MVYNASKGIAFLFNATLNSERQGQCLKIMVFATPLPTAIFDPGLYKVITSDEYMRYTRE